jgi:hypothetical protein
MATVKVMLNAKGVYSDRLRAEGVTVEQTNPRDAQAWKTSDFITKPGAVAALKDAHRVAVTLVGSAENPGNNEQRQGMKVWEKVAGTRALLDRPTHRAGVDGGWPLAVGAARPRVAPHHEGQLAAEECVRAERRALARAVAGRQVACVQRRRRALRRVHRHARQEPRRQEAHGAENHPGLEGAEAQPRRLEASRFCRTAGSPWRMRSWAKCSS